MKQKNIHNNFFYRYGFIDKNNLEVRHNIEKIRSVVFALNTDLKSKNGINEAQRYKKIYEDDHPYIRSICVAGKSYDYDNGEYWINYKANNDYDEILAFIGGVTNTYVSVSESRGKPLLGHYIIPSNEGFISINSYQQKPLK